MKAASGTSDSASPDSAGSGSTAKRSGASGPSAPGSVFQTDLTQAPFSGVNKFYFAAPSTAPTLLLAPVPVVAYPSHRVPRAIGVPVPGSSTTPSLSTKEAIAAPDASQGSGAASSKQRATTPDKDSSAVKSPSPSTNPSRIRKVAAAPDSDPEEGSPRRHPRKPGTSRHTTPSRTSTAMRKGTPAPMSAPSPRSASNSNPRQRRTNLPQIPLEQTKPEVRQFRPPAKSNGNSGKQPQATPADQPNVASSAGPHSAGAKPRAGAYAGSNSAVAKRKPNASRARPKQPASSACQANPGK